MSYGLYVWHASQPITAQEADAICDRLCSGELSAVAECDGVQSFVDELTQRYPQINDWNEDEIDNCPWSADFDQSDRHVAMCISFSRVNEVAPVVGQLAAKHGLVFATSGYSKDTFHAIALGQRGDLTDSEHVVWSLDRGAPYVPCPMLWGDEIYLLEDRSFFSCLGAADGKQHYLKHRLPGTRNFSASPVGAADRIYLLSEEGRTAVLKRGPQLELLADNSLDETFYASPAIVGNEIYLRGDKHLFCFSRSSGQ